MLVKTASIKQRNDIDFFGNKKAAEYQNEKKNSFVRWPVDVGVCWWELPGARGSGYLQPQAIYTFSLFLNSNFDISIVLKGIVHLEIFFASNLTFWIAIIIWVTWVSSTSEPYQGRLKNKTQNLDTERTTK